MIDNITTASEAENTTQDDTTIIRLVNPDFTQIVYDMEKYLHAGFMIHEQNYPYDNFTLKEVYLIRNADTIRITGERRKAMEAGKAVQTLENKREAMAKARAAVGKKKAEKEESNADQI